MKKVLVKASNGTYPVFIGLSIFESLPELLIKYNLPKRTFIIADKKLESIYKSRIKNIVRKIPGKKYCLYLPFSEKLKSFASAQLIISKMIEQKFGKDTLLISIGGGTVGDVAGFIASIYMRGIAFVNIPTTIISAVDSSIGGKTAINYSGIKNIIGTFYQPAFVLVDPVFFNSLQKNELVSGFGEVIKYSYLTDDKFYSKLLSNYGLFLRKDLDFLSSISYECIKIKSAVVSQDEFELNGIRRILNFGHTFAHAYESSSKYKLSHGKAVLAGLVSALLLSYYNRLLDKQQLEQMLALPLKLKSHIRLGNIDGKGVINFMKNDKKNRQGKIQFVLIKNFGELIVDFYSSKKSIYSSIRETKKWFF